MGRSDSGRSNPAGPGHKMNQTTHELNASGAFASVFTLAPYQSGALDGLTFAVKDNIDLAGHPTSYGSRPWADAHGAAVYNALCVDQLLGAGATCLGKTIADEYTYSLDGESYFFGTPINPGAPDRVPGGSSSGSASAVACGGVDFSIGTDSGGSVRVPAGFCGVWGMRPTLHRISEAGVLPFMPSVSTVGAFANEIRVLDAVMRTLLCSPVPTSEPIGRIYILEDAFALADPGVADAVRARAASLVDRAGVPMESITLKDILGGDMDLDACNSRALRVLQTAEFMNTVGGWIETHAPETGPGFCAAYEAVRSFPRRDLNGALMRCETIFRRLSEFTKKGDLFVFPTTPTIAPLKGSLTDLDRVMDFYDRTMAVTAFAGIGRMPEISIPVARVAGAPVGLSLAAGWYRDEFLLSAAGRLFGSTRGQG